MWGLKDNHADVMYIMQQVIFQYRIAEMIAILQAQGMPITILTIQFEHRRAHYLWN